jgi:predicted RNA-binding protein with PUA-like domain
MVRLMSWQEVVRIADSLPQDAVEAFWDELTILVDPRWRSVPARAVQKVLKAVQAVQVDAEAGQGVLEYIAVIGLVAIVFFVAATWLVDSGILEQIKTALQIP